MADFVKCPPQQERLLSREFLVFCTTHAGDLEAQLAALPPGRRPPRRTMRAVAERLELQNLDAMGAVLRRMREAWWPLAKGRRPPSHGDETTTTVMELYDGYLHVRLPVDGFFGVIAGDLLRVKHGTDVVMLTRQEGK